MVRLFIRLMKDLKQISLEKFVHVNKKSRNGVKAINRMAKIATKIKNCLAGIAYGHGLSKCASINPAAPLHGVRGILFIFSENDGMIIQAAAYMSGLPGGYRNNNGNFNNLGNNANFWSSTENNSNNAWNRNLNYNNTDVNRNDNNKQNGFSVRLVRDLKQSKRAWRPVSGRHVIKNATVII